MQLFKELSDEAQDLLKEILAHENEKSYWANRFKGLSEKDDAILSGCFKELQDNELINVLWGDNIPIHITILKDGYLYKSKKSQPSKIQFQSTSAMFQKYDIFISHANKDKNELVEELYNSLNELGLKIFYDKQSLEWGDKWKEKILEGTAKSEFAIIVISKNFFSREWTEKELGEFLSRQDKEGEKLILPILHNITVKQLISRYPSLADIQAINSKDYSCDKIALKFAKQYIKRLKSRL